MWHSSSRFGFKLHGNGFLNQRPEACYTSALFFFSFCCVHQQQRKRLQPLQQHWGLQQVMSLECSLPIQRVTSKQHTHQIKHTNPWSRKPSTEGSFNSVNCFLLTVFWLLCTETQFWNSRRGVNGEMCMEVGRRRSMHTGLKLFLGGIFWELTWNRVECYFKCKWKKIFKWSKHSPQVNSKHKYIRNH